MKRDDHDRLPIWCERCQCATLVLVAQLARGVCVCSGCRKPIELTPDFVAIIGASGA